MKNTGIVYDSAERTPVTLPEFAQLLPPLTGEQLAALEADILENGCYSPIIVNENLEIVDGHNRKELCERHGIPYNMVVFHFEDRLDAMRWAVETQKGRRNLNDWELGKIALKLKPMLRARAKANMSLGGGCKKKRNDSEPYGPVRVVTAPVNTRKDMADSVGISADQMGKIMKIDETGPQAVKDALDRREISVNRGYHITKQVQKLPKEEREQAAEYAVADGKRMREHNKSDDEADRCARIAAQFAKAIRTDFTIQPTEENIRCWVESCRMESSEICDAIVKLHGLAELYAAMEQAMRNLYPDAADSVGKER